MLGDTGGFTRALIFLLNIYLGAINDFCKKENISFQNDHFLLKCKKDWCVFCKQNKIMSNTSYFCPCCKKNLHPECFGEYHHSLIVQNVEKIFN